MNKVKQRYLASMAMAVGLVGCGSNSQAELSLSDKVNQEEVKKNQEFVFISPDENATYNYDTTSPFILYWKPKDNETIKSLTLTTKDQHNETRSFPIPLTDIITEDMLIGKSIEFFGQYVGSQMQSAFKGKEERVVFLEGDYETEARLETSQKEYISKVHYAIRK